MFVQAFVLAWVASMFELLSIQNCNCYPSGALIGCGCAGVVEETSAGDKKPAVVQLCNYFHDRP